MSTLIDQHPVVLLVATVIACLLLRFGLLALLYNLLHLGKAGVFWVEQLLNTLMVSAFFVWLCRKESINPALIVVLTLILGWILAVAGTAKFTLGRTPRRWRWLILTAAGSGLIIWAMLHLRSASFI